jgi:hypothetical protein
MTQLKKPDHIVFDDKEGYNAFKKEYATSLSAPNIKKDDISVFLQQSGTKVNHYFDQKFTEIKNELEKLIDLYELNQIVYNSELRFEPIMGFTYHLYQRKDGNKFISMVAPNEWNMPYICSITLNTDGQWVLQKGSSPKN